MEEKRRANGSIIWRHYKNERKIIHREDGPARLWYYSNGNFKQRQWIIRGKLHREDGPALINQDKNGEIYHQRYYINGKLHREDGPAVLSKDRKGEYYLRGKRSTKREWAEHLFYKDFESTMSSDDE